MRDLGQGRVEQLTADTAHLTARTQDRLYDLSGKIFVPRRFEHGAPRSAAYFADALWVTGGAGLYRLAQKTNHTLEVPYPGGLVTRLGDRLVYWGPGGVFTRGAADGPWTELNRAATRLFPTSDPRFPALFVIGESAQLFDAGSGALSELTLPVLARDVSAALILDGKIFLGTSGYGLIVREL